MSQIVENAFAVAFFAPLAVLLLLLFREIWRHNAPRGPGDEIGIEAKLLGVVALGTLIGTALTMWVTG